MHENFNKGQQHIISWSTQFLLIIFFINYLQPYGAITFVHIFQKFRLRTVFVCAQKCISFAHIFSVTSAHMFLRRFPWATAGRYDK